MCTIPTCPKSLKLGQEHVSAEIWMKYPHVIIINEQQCTNHEIHESKYRILSHSICQTGVCMFIFLLHILRLPVQTNSVFGITRLQLIVADLIQLLNMSNSAWKQTKYLQFLVNWHILDQPFLTDVWCTLRGPNIKFI